MIEFSWPYMLLLLPIPLLGRWVFFGKMNKRLGYRLKVPFFSDIKKIKTTNIKKETTNYMRLLLLLAAWFLIVLAAARPIEIADSWSIDVQGRDLMIAIDASGSMERPETVDGKTQTRFEIVKKITQNLVEKRKGDKVGLIIFGTKAFLYSPLSFDVSLVKELMQDTFAGMVGPSTAIGDALALSVKYLYDRPSESKVLILMTDGANQVGKFTIEQSLEMIKESKIKVYTIGIGFSNAQGANPISDEEIDLDEPPLIEIAEASGGMYFRVNTYTDLEKILLYIEQMEKIDELLIVQSVDEVYYLFLLGAIGIGLLLLILYLFELYSEYSNEKRQGEYV